MFISAVATTLQSRSVSVSFIQQLRVLCARLYGGYLRRRERSLPSCRGKEKNSDQVNKPGKTAVSAKKSDVAQNNCFRKDRGKASDWH